MYIDVYIYAARCPATKSSWARALYSRIMRLAFLAATHTERSSGVCCRLSLLRRSLHSSHLLLMFMVTQLSRTKYVYTQIFKNLDSEIIERQRCDRYRILDSNIRSKLVLRARRLVCISPRTQESAEYGRLPEASNIGRVVT